MTFLDIGILLLNCNLTHLRTYFSDDESDTEVSDDLTGDKKAVLDFMQNALPTELLLLSSCTEKKVNAIIEVRPFDGWRDLVTKFQTTKSLDTELLNSAQVR